MASKTTTGVNMAVVRDAAVGRKASTGSEEAHWHIGFGTKLTDVRAIKGLELAGQEIYYPKIWEMRRVPKRALSASQRNNPFPILRRRIVPLFPRYIFIRFDGAGRLTRLFELLGIEGLLCDDVTGHFQPTRLAENEVDKLKAMEGPDGVIPSKVTLKQLGFEVGEVVRIRNGALSGHNATVDQLPDAAIEELDESMRVRLLVDMLGRATVVECLLADLEKL